MNTQKFGSWVFFCLTVLAAELLAEMAMHLVASFMLSQNPYKAAAIQMLVAILVFFPAFQLIDFFVKKSSNKYSTPNGQSAKKGFYVILLSFIAGLLVIYGMYLRVKFGINIFEQIF